MSSGPGAPSGRLSALRKHGPSTPRPAGCSLATGSVVGALGPCRGPSTGTRPRLEQKRRNRGFQSAKLLPGLPSHRREESPFPARPRDAPAPTLATGAVESPQALPRGSLEMRVFRASGCSLHSASLWFSITKSITHKTGVPPSQRQHRRGVVPGSPSGASHLPLAFSNSPSLPKLGVRGGLALKGLPFGCTRTRLRL